MRCPGKKSVAAFALAAAFLADPAFAAGPKPVYRIDSVNVSTEGNRINVEARGAVRSGGWSDPRLVVKNAGPPTVILELRASPPGSDEAVIQSLLPVSATTTIRAPAGAATVQITSETNSISQPIGR